jgi:deazaflavin-dependent oxidoreductase (nitroreductase family)
VSPEKGYNRSVHIPYFMRHVNRVFTNPVIGTFAWLVPPLAVIHHRGRKSGHAYRTPVVAFRSAAGFVVPMTYGRDVDWARNTVRANGCTVERLGQRYPLRNPRIVNLKAAESRLPAALRPFFRAADFPGFVLLDEAPKRSGRAPAGAT